MKTPSFMIAEDPRLEDGRVFIIHTREPRILAEVFHFGPDEEAEWLAIQQQFEIGSRLQLTAELIAIGAVWVAQTKPIAPDRLAGLMRKMADWYQSYIEWEDIQMQDEE